MTQIEKAKHKLYKDKLENIDKNLTSLIAQKKTDANCNGLSFLF